MAFDEPSLVVKPLERGEFIRPSFAFRTADFSTWIV
jgi:hypothetical protein